MSKKSTVSIEEINFIIQNFPSYGRRYCARELNISLPKVAYQIKKFKLVKNSNFNVKSFISVNEDYVAYVLGFMWADGYVSKSTNSFNVGGVINDIEEIEWMFEKLGKWCKSIQDRSKNGWQTAKYLIGHNSEIHEFLRINDYCEKSVLAPIKILSKISEKNVHYFFRGVVDGDGCFYFNKKNYLRQFSVSSSYSQDWSVFVNLFEKLNIKFKIILVDKKSKSSSIRIAGKDVLKIGEYLYKGSTIGLKRKKDKYLLIKESYVNY